MEAEAPISKVARGNESRFASILAPKKQRGTGEKRRKREAVSEMTAQKHTSPHRPHPKLSPLVISHGCSHRVANPPPRFVVLVCMTTKV